MSYNSNFNRHNSIGGNWNLPPINGFNGDPLGKDPSDGNNSSNSSLNINSKNLPPSFNSGQAPMSGFRNPWYYSNQSNNLSNNLASPTSANSGGSPTKTSSIPLLQQQQAQQKRLSFANQLPVTYEDEDGNVKNIPNFIHPPTRADNPFNQYYTNPDVQLLGPERRMSAAVDNFGNPKLNDFNQLEPGFNPQFPNHNTMNVNPGMNYNNNRRSSVAVAGYNQSNAYNNYAAVGGVNSGINNVPHQFNYPLNYQPPKVNYRYGRSQSVAQYDQYQQIVQHQRSTKRRKPAPKLTKIYNKTDLKPRINQQPKYRRCSVNSIHISPVNALSVYLTESFSICQPKKFQYSRTTNPKRVLTKPSEPKCNNGFDNEDGDYILYVNDILGTEEGRKYIVLDLLGSGTFGQVVKCQNLSNQSVVAVKVIKSRPAYMNQSLTEVRLLEYLNAHGTGNKFIKLLDTFMHKEHLCLVFELLASNLYELIKQNQFQGLNMKLVKILTKQLLESMAQLKSFQMIHCDLKPENILLCQPDKPEIKVIDFGSACFTRETIYSYVQSRFYRSPEVILGLPYTESIDMWSVGCIVGELFLGLPLFPGTSEYNQIWKIVDMLGVPPRHMIEVGKASLNFFNKIDNGPDAKPNYTIKNFDEYVDFLKSRNKEEKSKKEQKNKNYFKHKLLKDIVLHYRLPSKKMTNSMIEKECEERLLLVDFLDKVLTLNPLERLTPQEALKHPFVKNVELSNQPEKRRQFNEV
ncbi:dual specificity protein kinase Yak1p [[Candida] jaroonii]|uniref:Dual specificity protein kinase Yak1p n=1 Tax=[Candida] jaroonii TaxID=467808 RepID=A0ACA9YFH3_9ASCO|nr:dual specificity protein kinase Yak1p [[Candida] jaroonii]